MAIVEDDVDLSRIYANVLKREGFHIAYVSISGEEIISSIRRGGPNESLDLVLMDYHLDGGMDGLKAAKEVKKLVPDARIVLVTGDGSVGAVALEAGFGFVEKPINIRNLIDKINSVLKTVAV